ncbi:MAG: terminase large subunit [Candidatus Acidiferrales bacterium]
MPKGGSRSFRKAWHRITTDLMQSRKLALCDQQMVCDYIEARAAAYKCAGERKIQARADLERLEKVWADRPAFPEPTAVIPPEAAKPAITLEQFIATVAHCRATFDSRVVPGQSFTLDENNVPYEFHDGDATTVARSYCQDCIGGAFVVGELTRRMAARTLDDLEHAHERGYVWDPWEARLLVQWFEVFCDIKLEPWEVHLVASIFAWKDAAGDRRFKQAWLSVGRKNGKTAIAGGIGLFGLVADQTKFAEVYASATKKDQARITYRDACRMVAGNPQLKQHVKQWSGQLEVEDTDCIFEPLSSDVRSSDGTRPSVVICDECHEWSDRTQFDKLISGMVMRKNRLIICTTTAGDNLESFCAGKEDFCEKILTGVAPDDSQFVAIYRMAREDDYKDATQWLKSNPNLGVSVLPAALQGQLKEIEEDPSALNGFLRFACNQWVTLRAGCTFPMDRIDACRGAEFKDMDPLAIRAWFIKAQLAVGKKCWAGFDYGEVSDLACFCLFFPDFKFNGQPPKHVLLPFYFMPEKNMLAKEKLWRVPLTAWARQGWLTLLPGDLADPTLIGGHIEKICGSFNVAGVGFDRWGGVRAMMADLTLRHILSSKEIPQHEGFLSAPSKEFKLALLKGDIATLDNPVLRWNISNVELVNNLRGGMMPHKANGDPNKKIDAVSAAVNAMYLWKDADFKPAMMGKIYSL